MIKEKNNMGIQPTHTKSRFLKTGEIDLHHVSNQFRIHFNEARKGGIL